MNTETIATISQPTKEDYERLLNEAYATQETLRRRVNELSEQVKVAEPIVNFHGNLTEVLVNFLLNNGLIKEALSDAVERTLDNYDVAGEHSYRLENLVENAVEEALSSATVKLSFRY